MGSAPSSNNLGSKELADDGNVSSQSQPTTAKDSPSSPFLSSSVVRRNKKRRQRQRYKNKLKNVKNILGYNNTVPVTPTEYSPSPSPQRRSIRKGRVIFRAAPSVSCNCCFVCVTFPFSSFLALMLLVIRRELFVTFRVGNFEFTLCFR